MGAPFEDKARQAAQTRIVDRNQSAALKRGKLEADPAPRRNERVAAPKHSCAVLKGC